MWDTFPPNISPDERKYFIRVRDLAAELAGVLAEPLDPVGVRQLSISAIRLENAQNPHGLRYDDERRFATIGNDVLLQRGLNLVRLGLHAILKVCQLEHVCEIPEHGRLAPDLFTGGNTAEKISDWVAKHAIRQPGTLEAKDLVQCREYLVAGVRLISGRLAGEKIEPEGQPSPGPNKLTYVDIAKMCQVSKGWVEDHKKDLGRADFPGRGRLPHQWRSDNPKVLAFIAAHGPMSVSLTPDKELARRSPP